MTGSLRKCNFWRVYAAHHDVKKRDTMLNISLERKQERHRMRILPKAMRFVEAAAIAAISISI
jgi:hypothetical protein